MNNIGIQIAMMVFSALLAALVYLVQDTRKSMQEKQKHQESETEAVKKDLADFKAVMPRQYVLREDFIRSTATLEAKIDGVSRDIGEIKESIAKLVGGGK